MIKKYKIAYLVLSIVLTGLMVACGSKAVIETSQPATVHPTQIPSVPTEALASVPVETVIPLTSSTTGATSGVSFAGDVLPILKANCSSCHGGSKSSGGFQINSYQTVMAGSKTGDVIQPGDGKNSYLVQLLEKGTMPRRGPKLSDTQIQLIIDWINAGALDN